MKKPSLKDGSFKTILDSSHNGIVIVDREGIVIFFNSAAKNILDLEDEKIEGKHFSSVSQEAWDDFEKIVVSGEPQLGKKFEVGGQTLIVNRTPIRDRGKIIGVLSIFQDISEFEKITSELSSYRRMVKEMDAIIESSYDGLYITDGQANTLRVSSSWEKITGLMAKDVIGKNMADLERQGYFSKSVTLMVLKEKRPLSIQAKVVTGREVLVSGSPIFDDDGNIIMVVSNVRDLTDIRRLSRQLEQSKKLTEQYRNKLEKLKIQLVEHEDIIAESKAMKDVLELAIRVAQVDVLVLITGETGVGKEIVAKFIHNNSKRVAKGLFVTINCGAIPESLLETELFGYESGAFTGSSPKGKIGLFESAEGGTIMLDEIGELSVGLQVKLLRAIQDLKITRVGGVKPKKIDVRLISITNRDLKKMVENGNFREDLYFRLNVVPIYIPPLKERRDDILHLINFFLHKFNLNYGKNVHFSRVVIDHLINYDWPGNVRELSNLIERLVVVTPHDEVLMEDLPDALKQDFLNLPISQEDSLKKAVRQFEVSLMRKAINKHGSVQQAANYLNVDPATIYRKLKTAKQQN